MSRKTQRIPRAIQFSGKQLNYLMILVSLNTKIRVLRVLRDNPRFRQFENWMTLNASQNHLVLRNFRVLRPFFKDPVRLETRTIGINLAIFMVFRRTVSIDAAPTGLGFLLENAATEIPSLRDSRGFWSLQSFCIKSGSVRKPNLPDLVTEAVIFS